VPYPPTLSGGAAAALTFDEDEPPTDAVGGVDAGGSESDHPTLVGTDCSHPPVPDASLT
jgi:hypothetical protein